LKERTETCGREAKWTYGDELNQIGQPNKSKSWTALGARKRQLLTTPGRCISLGSFCVMSRYIKAADIRKAIIHPVPCVAIAHKARAVTLRDDTMPILSAAPMRAAASGAVKRSGYAGKTQTGVIMCTGKTLLVCHRVSESKSCRAHEGSAMQIRGIRMYEDILHC
jgi:hypothetical protein